MSLRVLHITDLHLTPEPGSEIYGADPDAMARAAAIVSEAYQPDFIDINFGCPVKKVVQRNGGSGCLRDMDLVERIVRATAAATPLPLTVKTRSGWNELCRHPVEIALRMQDAGGSLRVTGAADFRTGGTGNGRPRDTSSAWYYETGMPTSITVKRVSA